MVTVILPYLQRNEIEGLLDSLNSTFIDYITEQDTNRLGPDLMYQKLWNQINDDIIILHSDMSPMPEDKNNAWYSNLCNYADEYPEAGIIGSKLLYPAQQDGKFVIQYAGGKFTNGIPDHFGSGLDLGTNKTSKELELDIGQYDFVREVAWATFGGIYIRRSVLNSIGNFDPRFEWSYNRDVDYCLMAREKGFKIYQTPVSLLHYESRDVKRIRTQELIEKEHRNLLKLQEKWKGSPLYQTLDKRI